MDQPFGTKFSQTVVKLSVKALAFIYTYLKQRTKAITLYNYEEQLSFSVLTTFTFYNIQPTRKLIIQALLEIKLFP